MTYSYLCSVPLLMTAIKYQEGYISIPTVGIVPKPYQLWTHPQRTWLTAIYIMFSMAWALEIVSHLEELCFWLFLINVGAAQTSWFRSVHFKCWVVGSLSAVIGLPVLAVFMRADPLKIIRVVFRFMFVLPLLTLAADGIKPDHNHVNESPFWTDLLAMLGAIGCIVSSIITLLIFFPRSIAKEAGYKPRQKTLSQNSRGVHIGPKNNQNQPQQIISTPQDVKDPSIYDAPPPEPTYTPPTKRDVESQPRVRVAPIDRAAATGGGAWEMVDYQQYQQHGVILPTVAPRIGRSGQRQTALHPMVLNYTSPIDLIEGWDESDAFRPTHY
ncbi:hypothetical protein FRC06_007520 [Ceratobasidium sp. 370]|nr:hypothetical protein FRC06_007520 [Ceratobasidium sp. 370]